MNKNAERMRFENDGRFYLILRVPSVIIIPELTTLISYEVIAPIIEFPKGVDFRSIAILTIVSN